MLTTGWRTGYNGSCTRGFMKLLLCVQLSQAASCREAALRDGRGEQHSLLLVELPQGSRLLKCCPELRVELARHSCGSVHTSPHCHSTWQPRSLPWSSPVPLLMCPSWLGTRSRAKGVKTNIAGENMEP